MGLEPSFPFSVVLVSDCVYDDAAYEPLVAALDALVGPDTVRAAAAEERRLTTQRSGEAHLSSASPHPTPCLCAPFHCAAAADELRKAEDG